MPPESPRQDRRFWVSLALAKVLQIRFKGPAAANRLNKIGTLCAAPHVTATVDRKIINTGMHPSARKAVKKYPFRSISYIKQTKPTNQLLLGANERLSEPFIHWRVDSIINVFLFGRSCQTKQERTRNGSEYE
jgi:hypothetical protein